jgi:acyl-CoA dehydrogenase
MNFELNERQLMIANTAKSLAAEFGPEYWRGKDERHEFGGEFWEALSGAGFAGLVIPEEYGGAGCGTTELMIAMEELAAGGCGMAGAWYLILSEVFGGLSILRHGTQDQKRKYLPGIASGKTEFCMALTEPDAGSNTSNIRTFARKDGDYWIINGSKTFISGADRAKGMLIVARTAPKEANSHRTAGLSLFLADLPDKAVEIVPISKHGINYSHTCLVNIDNLKVPAGALIPPEGGGWNCLLDTLNPERMSFAAAGIGIARLAIHKAVSYAWERKVFANTSIGSYQSLQFPMAEAYAGLEAARLLNLKAADLFDRGQDAVEVGAAGNMAKALVVENATKAVFWAMQVFGGYGYTTEYDVERWWREVNLIRLAPVTQQMTLGFIGEKVMGMPKSYVTQ